MRLAREVVLYGAVGGLQILVDWLTFVVLSKAGTEAVYANVIGRVAGAAVGFILNGAVTFKGAEGSRLGWRRLGRFMLSWATMTLLSTLAIGAIDHSLGLRWAWLLKPCVDIVLAALGFVASRHWIYK